MGLVTGKVYRQTKIQALTALCEARPEPSEGRRGQWLVENADIL